MTLPVSSFEEAIELYGDSVGVPEVGSHFIILERSYRNDERGQHAGTKQAKLFIRTASNESESVVRAKLVAEIYEGSEDPPRQIWDSAESIFEEASFTISENDQLAAADQFAHDLDPYVRD